MVQAYLYIVMLEEYPVAGNQGGLGCFTMGQGCLSVPTLDPEICWEAQEPVKVPPSPVAKWYEPHGGNFKSRNTLKISKEELIPVNRIKQELRYYKRVRVVKSCRISDRTG